MSFASAIFRATNPIVEFLLKSPLHVLLSEHTMIITFEGRKTGRKYSTPVSYFKQNHAVYCYTRARWWKNIGEGSNVGVRIRGVEYAGYARAIPDDTQRKAQALELRLEANPKAGMYYGVSVNSDGDPNSEEILKFATDNVMIFIEIDQS
jgi:hypothetical protein